MTPPAAHADRTAWRLPSRAALTDAALFAALVVIAGALSILRGQDANWDLQNYHYYNPWAWLSGRIFASDLAAAQLQTFHNPLLDVPFYAMVAWQWPPMVIAFTLAIPAGVAAYFLVLILRHLFADLSKAERRVAIACAFAIGVTSAMGRATLGTTMNEWPLAALALAALWLIVRALAKGHGVPVHTGALLLAGALFGIAAGGKLTAGTFAVAMATALVLRGPMTWAATLSRVREAIVFSCGVLAGFAVTYGPWGYALWTHYGSPIFPYGNEWIRSPWWVKAQVIGRRYGPHTVLEWLRFPFDLYSPKPYYVSEVGYRDVRMPLLYGMAIACGFIWLWLWVVNRGRMPRPAHAGVSRAWRFVVAFFIVSFLLWTAQHSNYRYLLTADLLTGAILVTLVQRNLRAGHAPAMMVAIAILVVATTRGGTWGRVPFGGSWFDVRGPELERNALVIMATDAPMAHVIPFLSPVPSRVVGIDNGIVNVMHDTLLEDAVNAAIARHEGPLYALTDGDRDGVAALSARGLLEVTSSCAPVHSNLLAESLTLCRVIRASDASPPR